MQSSKVNTITIIYDEKCPVCDHFTKGIRLRRLSDQLITISARDSKHPEVKRIKTLNIDLNESMVVLYDDEIYIGAEAMTWLAMMTSPSHTLNQLIFMCFKYPRFGKRIYPVLRAARLLLLRLLRRSPIR